MRDRTGTSQETIRGAPGYDSQDPRRATRCACIRVMENDTRPTVVPNATKKASDRDPKARSDE